MSLIHSRMMASDPDYNKPVPLPEARIRVPAPIKRLRISDKTTIAIQDERIKRLRSDLADLVWVIQASTPWAHPGHFTLYFNSLRNAKEIHPRVSELIGRELSLTMTPCDPIVATREARIKRLVDDVAETLWILAITTVWAGKEEYQAVVCSLLCVDDILPRYHELTDMPLPQFHELINSNPTSFTPDLGPCATWFALRGKPIAWQPDALPVARWSATTVLSPQQVQAIYASMMQPHHLGFYQPSAHGNRSCGPPVSPNFVQGVKGRDSWMVRSSQGVDCNSSMDADDAAALLFPPAPASSQSTAGGCSLNL
jgi:hypothetical protein